MKSPPQMGTFSPSTGFLMGEDKLSRQVQMCLLGRKTHDWNWMLAIHQKRDRVVQISLSYRDALLMASKEALYFPSTFLKTRRERQILLRKITPAPKVWMSRQSLLLSTHYWLLGKDSFPSQKSKGLLGGMKSSPVGYPKVSLLIPLKSVSLFCYHMVE